MSILQKIQKWYNQIITGELLLRPGSAVIFGILWIISNNNHERFQLELKLLTICQKDQHRINPLINERRNECTKILINNEENLKDPETMP